MQSLRAFLHAHRRTAALLVALALLVKALVPGGYMVAAQGKVLTVTICADASGAKMTRDIVLPADGTTSGGERSGDHSGKAQAPCPYAGLGMAGLANGDALLLAIGIAFALALSFAPVRPARHLRLARLRPPLRGPPLLPAA
jgi:hypothetical protein